MELLGNLYIAGELKKDVDTKSNNIFDNPFGKGKVYKSNDIARWTFEGKLELLGKETVYNPEKEVSKTKQKPLHTSVKQNYDFLKTYDYSKVNRVLERNTAQNFKTISKIDVRKYFTCSVEPDILEHTWLMSF